MLSVPQHEEENNPIDNGDYINLKVNGQVSIFSWIFLVANVDDAKYYSFWSSD